MRRVGVLGGSFDPVHSGHLLLAEEILRELLLDEIIFMPTRIQPFKQDKETASAEDRINMLNLALASNNKFSITTVETDRDEVSYTVTSLKLLKKQMSDDTELIFILGYDMLMNIRKWWNADELLETFSFAVGIRKGVESDEINQFIEGLRKEYNTQIYAVQNRMFDLSSTEIKDRIKNGKSIKYLVPDTVIEYIKEKCLYRE